MNAATKLKWAARLSLIVAMLAALQFFVNENNFPAAVVAIAGPIIFYLVTTLTVWKQYLSPDVNNTGATVTIWFAVIASIAGIGDLIGDLSGAFHIPDKTAQYIRLGITIVVTLLNVFSNTIFPSQSLLLKKQAIKDAKKYE